MTECHLSVMSQQTITATNRASVMQAVIHAWYMSGLISRSVYIAIGDSGLEDHDILELHCSSILYHNLNFH